MAAPSGGMAAPGGRCFDLIVLLENHWISKNFVLLVYRFAQPKLCSTQDILNPVMDEKLCEFIRQQNVLIIDDVTTSGSTLNEILRTLRILNEDNKITIFSLIGRKDLMAETV